MEEIQISKVAYYAEMECDSFGLPAKWASIHVYVFWDCKSQKYIIKEESYLGTRGASNEYESERVCDSAEEVNKALHAAREYADHYRQVYKD